VPHDGGWRGAKGQVPSSRHGSRGTYVLASIAVAFTVFMVLEPEAAFSSAVEGLRVWWEIVFPALLPFFIGSEILMGLGVVHFAGVVLEPLMRPVFNVPGAGSFVMAMGLASGYPIGSVLTARLRKQQLCNKAEAERLVCFTNTADPLFMSGAVAVGMFRNQGVAPVIMLAHYLSSLSVGLVMRFWRRRAPRTPAPTSSGAWIFRRAAWALVEARRRDGRPLGRLMGDAVRQAVNNLLLIGGFIILFSVLIRITQEVGLLGLAAAAAARVVAILGLNPDTAQALLEGMLEITIGTEAAARCPAPLADRLMAASAIIAWSGLSVHAQVAAMIQGTDIDIRPYVGARVLHALLAAAYTPLVMAVLPVSVSVVWCPLPTWWDLLAAAWSRFLLASAWLVAACALGALLRR